MSYDIDRDACRGCGAAVDTEHAADCPEWAAMRNPPPKEDLASQLIEALDLLDRLVDDTLDTVCKQRVMAWKAMVRRTLLGQEDVTWSVATLYAREGEING